MEILTSNYKQLLVHDVLQNDMDAYIHPIKHYVTTSDGHTIILAGYRNGRLVYAVQTTDKTYKREAKKIEKYITEAIENNVLYESPLKEQCFIDKRVILYSSDNFSLLIEHDLYLTRNRIQFITNNIKWCNIEELINQYELALEANRLRDIRYYRDELEMLQGFDFMWLSNMPYIISLLERYVECLEKDTEV
jgi:hypothetical protein